MHTTTAQTANDALQQAAVLPHPFHATITLVKQPHNPLNLCQHTIGSLAALTGLNDLVLYRLAGRELQQISAVGGKLGPAGIKQALTLNLGMGIVGRAAYYQHAQRVLDTRLDRDYYCDDQPRLSELAVPVLYHGQCLGVIDSEHPQQGFYTPFHQQWFEVAATILIPALLKLNGDHRQDTSPATVPSAAGPVEPAALDQSTLSLQQEPFYAAVEQALHHYHHSDRLQYSALIRFAIIQAWISAGMRPVEAIRQRIREQLAIMKNSARCDRWAEMLQAAYLDRQLSRDILADRFHCAPSTLRRQLRNARQQLCAELWQLELQHSQL